MHSKNFSSFPSHIICPVSNMHICVLCVARNGAVKAGGVPIYQISKILSGDMAKFAILEIGIFLKLYRYIY